MHLNALNIPPPRLPDSWTTTASSRAPVLVHHDDATNLAIAIAETAINLAEQSGKATHTVQRLRDQLQRLRDVLRDTPAV